MNELIKTNSLPNLAGEGEKFDFLPQQNLRKERDIWYKIKLIYSVLIKKISSLLSVDYYKSNNENQFKDIQLQLHATNVTNPYTFSIQGNMNFSGICELDKPFHVIAYGREPWYFSDWPDAYKVSDLTTINGGAKFNVKNAINLEQMFWFRSNLTSLDLSNFDTSNVTDMSSMFVNCYGLKSLDLSSNFDTSNVTNMNSMFWSCSKLTSLDLSNFDTSNVTNMTSMFNGCFGLTSLDLSNFNTNNVTNMTNMFSGCSSLKILDLSNFDTSNVTKMNNMFKNCPALETLDYSLTGFWRYAIAPDLSACTNLKTLRLYNANPAAINEFINHSNLPSTCQIIRVS